MIIKAHQPHRIHFYTPDRLTQAILQFLQTSLESFSMQDLQTLNLLGYSILERGLFFQRQEDSPLEDLKLQQEWQSRQLRSIFQKNEMQVSTQEQLAQLRKEIKQLSRTNKVNSVKLGKLQRLQPNFSHQEFLMYGQARLLLYQNWKLELAVIPSRIQAIQDQSVHLSIELHKAQLMLQQLKASKPLKAKVKKLKKGPKRDKDLFYVNEVPVFPRIHYSLQTSTQSGRVQKMVELKLQAKGRRSETLPVLRVF